MSKYSMYLCIELNGGSEWHLCKWRLFSSTFCHYTKAEGRIYHEIGDIQICSEFIKYQNSIELKFFSFSLRNSRYVAERIVQSVRSHDDVMA